MILTVLSGTNRPGSYTRKVAGYVESQLKEILATSDQIKMLDLQNLPSEIFSNTSYREKPASFEPFKEMMLKTDGIITVLPEYNGSFPGVLKYFIDMLPFPESLQRKPAAFVGVADGRFGALRAVEQMQQIWAYRNAYLFQERVFITHASENVLENGCPKDPHVMKLLNSEITGFVEFTKKFLKV